MREWLTNIEWISPRWFVALFQREAVGHEGEQYEWTRIIVGEIRDGRFAFACQFDVDDEDIAFAYAEEQVRAISRPSAITNLATELLAGGFRALQAGEVDAMLACYSDDYVFDDRRSLSGDPFSGKDALRAATQRILQQFSSFEPRILAVRGERLSLGWSRWSDDAGNQTSHLHVVELDDDGLAARDIRFDEDDFEGAYQSSKRATTPEKAPRSRLPVTVRRRS